MRLFRLGRTRSRQTELLTEQTRYRITGAVFLVAVAIIAFPMLFDGAGIDPLELPPVTPEPIDVSALEDAAAPPDSAGLLAARDALEAEIDPEGYRRETGTRLGDPVLAEETAAPAAPTEAWAVQLGSFSSRDNAVALRDRLRADGYDALLSNVKASATKLTRVAVGPMIERDNAVRLRQELDDRYGDLEPRIVRFSH